MNGSKKIIFTFLTALLALTFTFSPNTYVSANNLSNADELCLAAEGTTKIKIKIIIIIIIKKKKVVEITDMRLAGDSKNLRKNEILADAYIEEGKLFIYPSRGIAARSQYIVSDGFKVSKEVSLKMGAKGELSLKAGKIDLVTNKLGNFEIQD